MQSLSNDLVGDVRAVVVGSVDMIYARRDRPWDTATTPSESLGGPHTPRPASCIAPLAYPLNCQ
jgi:hypothetical protein